MAGTSDFRIRMRKLGTAFLLHSSKKTLQQPLHDFCPTNKKLQPAAKTKTKNNRRRNKSGDSRMPPLGKVCVLHLYIWMVGFMWNKLAASHLSFRLICNVLVLHGQAYEKLMVKCGILVHSHSVRFYIIYIDVCLSSCARNLQHHLWDNCKKIIVTRCYILLLLLLLLLSSSYCVVVRKIIMYVLHSSIYDERTNKSRKWINLRYRLSFVDFRRSFVCGMGWMAIWRMLRTKHTILASFLVAMFLIGNHFRVWELHGLSLKCLHLLL